MNNRFFIMNIIYPYKVLLIEEVFSSITSIPSHLALVSLMPALPSNHQGCFLLTDEAVLPPSFSIVLPVSTKTSQFSGQYNSFSIKVIHCAASVLTLLQIDSILNQFFNQFKILLVFKKLDNAAGNNLTNSFNLNQFIISSF